MKRGDVVRTPQGSGRLWSIGEDIIVVEMDYTYLVDFPEGEVTTDDGTPVLRL